MVSWPWDLLGIPGCGHRPLTVTQQEVLGMSVPLYLELPHCRSAGSLGWKKTSIATQLKIPIVFPAEAPGKKAPWVSPPAFTAGTDVLSHSHHLGRWGDRRSLLADPPWEPSLWHWDLLEELFSWSASHLHLSPAGQPGQFPHLYRQRGAPPFSEVGRVAPSELTSLLFRDGSIRSRLQLVTAKNQRTTQPCYWVEHSRSRALESRDSPTGPAAHRVSPENIPLTQPRCWGRSGLLFWLPSLMTSF